MEKQKHLNDLLKAVKEYSEKFNPEDVSVLLVTVNNELKNATSDFKGNSILLAQGFGNQMENNPELNRLMKSLFGSYLSQHPEEREEFIKGLKIAKFNFGSN